MAPVSIQQQVLVCGVAVAAMACLVSVFSTAWDSAREGLSGGGWLFEANPVVQAMFVSVAGGWLMGWVNRAVHLLTTHLSAACFATFHRKLTIPEGIVAQNVRQFLESREKTARTLRLNNATFTGGEWRLQHIPLVDTVPAVVWGWGHVLLLSVCGGELNLEAYGVRPRPALDAFVAQMLPKGDAARLALTQNAATTFPLYTNYHGWRSTAVPLQAPDIDVLRKRCWGSIGETTAGVLG